MTKEEQIAAKKLKPIEVGDYVIVSVPYIKIETLEEGRGKKKKQINVERNLVFNVQGTVTAIEGGQSRYKISISSTSVPYELDKIVISTYERSNKFISVEPQYVQPTFGECGANPFPKERMRVNFYNQNIESLLSKAGYGKHDNTFDEPSYRETTDGDNSYGGINFNPYITDANGDKQYYQRGLVWTLEQKQLLIDSIYNGIEIGKFLFRFNSWERLNKEAHINGHGYSMDCVDGKQRFYAILEFVQNKFPDSNGHYWKDLSPNAHGRFLNYQNLSYGELSDTASDSDVLDNFLTLNWCGTPILPEHIEYVKTFILK